MKISFTTIFSETDKTEILMIIKLKVNFSSVLHKNVCCGYSLGLPCQCNSNEYPQHTIFWRNMENYR